MSDLELNFTASLKSTNGRPNVEIVVPFLNMVERDGQQVAALTNQCYTVQEFDAEIRRLLFRLQVLREAAARAFRELDAQRYP